MAIIRRGEVGRDVTRTTGWDPFEMMQEFLTRGLGEVGGAGLATFSPDFEVKETKDSYVFKADLPGLKEEDLEISLTGNRLTISGRREAEKKDEGERYFTWERSYGSFTRSFTLPQGIDVDQVQGDLKDGVLTVSVPKKPEVQPKRISLRGGAGKAKA